MKDTFSQIFNELLKILSREGARIIRLQFIAAGRQVVQGVRCALLLQYFVLIFCFITALSFFSTLILAATQLSEKGALFWTWPLGICLGMCIFFSILLYLSIREKTWLRAFNVEQVVDSAMSLAFPRSRSDDGLSPEILAKIVEDAVERKLQERAKNISTSHTSTQI